MLATREILELEPVKKIELIDEILQSLNIPNKELDTLWIEESNRRLKLYKSGKNRVVQIDEILQKYEKI